MGLINVGAKFVRFFLNLTLTFSGSSKYLAVILTQGGMTSRIDIILTYILNALCPEL